jgi:hypothetical protein
MNLSELRSRVSWMVGFNEGQVDQDFRGPSTNTNKRIDWSINESYKDEVNQACLYGSEEYFRQEYSFTWAADAATKEIPEDIQQKRLLYLRDDTDATIGPTIQVWDSRQDGSGIYIIRKDLWGWYPAPSSAKTMTAVYTAEARDMTEATDKPFLMPDRYHELICWSAGIMLRTVADEDAAPRTWFMKRDELRNQFWKEVQRGSPTGMPPKRIRNNNPDILEYY